MERIGRACLAAVTLLLLLLLWVDVPVADARTADRRTVTVHRHDYSQAMIQRTARSLFVTRRALPESWCGQIRSGDDTTNEHNNGHDVKIVYAYAADQPNRVTTYTTLMQRTAAAVSAAVSNASAGRLGVRWDTGTSCGPQYVDIQTVRLPRNLASYTASPSQLSSLFFSDVRSALGLGSASSGTRNYLVFADYLGTGPGAPGGQGQILSDSTPSGNNYHSLGGRIAALYGRGQSTFFQDSWGISYTFAAALHEVLHALGAVQNDSPNASGGWHCNDGLDVMCYADGGSTSRYDPSHCQVSVIDCRGDDYFAVDPPSGGYLQTHWNVAASVFLCRVEHCQTPTLAPQVRLTSDPAAPVVGAPVTFIADAADDGPQPLTYDWDLDGRSGYELSSASNRVTVTARSTTRVRVRVRDAAGAFGEQFATLQPRTNAPPTARLVRQPYPGPVLTGQPVSFDAAGSDDSDGQMSSWAWTINGVPVSARAAFEHVFSQPGSYTVKLTVVDDTRLQDTATQTVQVIDNQPPTVSARVLTSGPYRAGSPITFLATASDPEGQPLTYDWDLDGDLVTDTTGVRATHAFPGPGAHQARVTVRDPAGVSAAAQVTVTIAANQTPVVTVTASPDRPSSGQPVRLTARAADADRDPLTLTWLLDGVEIARSAQLLRTFDAGVHVLTVAASDGRGGVTHSTFKLTVTAPDRPTVTTVRQTALSGTPARQRRSSIARGLVVKGAVAARGQVTATASLSRSQAVKLGLAAARMTVAKTVTYADSRGRWRIRLRPTSRRVRRVLARRPSALTVTVTTTVAQQKVTAKRVVRLR